MRQFSPREAYRVTPQVVRLNDFVSQKVLHLQCGRDSRRVPLLDPGRVRRLDPREGRRLDHRRVPPHARPNRRPCPRGLPVSIGRRHGAPVTRTVRNHSPQEEVESDGAEVSGDAPRRPRAHGAARRCARSGYDNLMLGGGPSIPVGETADEFDTGFNARASLGLGLPGLPLGLRADPALSRFPEKAHADQALRVMSGVLHGLYTLPLPGARPYFLAGLGLFSTECSEAESYLRRGLASVGAAHRAAGVGGLRSSPRDPGRVAVLARPSHPGHPPLLRLDPLRPRAGRSRDGRPGRPGPQHGSSRGVVEPRPVARARGRRARPVLSDGRPAGQARGAGRWGRPLPPSCGPGPAGAGPRFRRGSLPARPSRHCFTHSQSAPEARR